MKHSSDNVIKELKRQMKVEKARYQPFLEARKVAKEREKARETEYQKFKTEQQKRRHSDEMLRKYLSKGW